MKNPSSTNVLMLCILLMTSIFGYSQTTDLQVVTTAGNEHVTSRLHVNWTVGEPVIKTIANKNIYLTQGFNQVDWQVVSTWDFVPLDMDIAVYPNPMSRDLTLNFTDFYDYEGEYRFLVYDMLYKPVFEQVIEDEITQYNLQTLRNGTYVIHVVDEKGTFVKTFRVLKNE